MTQISEALDPSVTDVTAGGRAVWPELSPWLVAALAVIGGSFGVAGWAFYIWAFRGDPGQDWMVFYTAARAYLDGNLPAVFDGESLTAALNQRFAAWLALPLHLHPWVYPPPFLLLFLPFGLLPPVISLVLFLLTGFAAALATALPYARHGTGRWIVGLSLALCPAVPFDVMTGQNAFFTTALLAGGFGLLGRAPLPAGAVLGVLTYKPQFWLMVPVALVAARQWRALAAAAATASILALASLAVFGVAAWHAWFELMTGGSEAFRAWVAAGRLNGISVFACLGVLGVPNLLANLAQVAAIAIAAGIVFWTFRQPASPSLRLAAVLAATLLAAPHASASDAVLLGLAASLFLAEAAGQGLRLLPAAIAIAAWICPLFNPPSVFRAGCMTPAVILLLLASILIATRETASPAGGR